MNAFFVNESYILVKCVQFTIPQRSAIAIFLYTTLPSTHTTTIKINDSARAGFLSNDVNNTHVQTYARTHGTPNMFHRVL